MLKPTCKSGIRNGVTIAELLVAATLLTAGIAFVTRGVVHTKRLFVDIRHYQLALDELSNQLERLRMMRDGERELAIANLEASQEIRSLLPHVLINANEIADADGKRIKMDIHWSNGPSQSISLVGWVRESKSIDVSDSTALNDRNSRLLADRRSFIFPFETDASENSLSLEPEALADCFWRGSASASGLNRFVIQEESAGLD